MSKKDNNICTYDLPEHEHPDRGRHVLIYWGNASKSVSNRTTWFNSKHRIIETFEPSGQRIHTCYVDNDIEYHRDDNPAVIRHLGGGQNDSLFYFQHGKPHRIGGPCSITMGRDFKYAIDGTEYSVDEYCAKMMELDIDEELIIMIRMQHV